MKDIPTKSFASAEAWHKWLQKNHATSDGIWLRIFKKDSGTKTVTYAEALDEALCFGWIDGQRDKYDAESFVQKFTPRRPKSLWSKRNQAHVARLEKEDRMQPAGLKEVEQAKADGRWESAYDSAATMKVPDDFVKELKKDKKAYEFFLSLNKTNTFAIAWRLATAKKPETREKRMKALLEMMRSGKKLH